LWPALKKNYDYVAAAAAADDDDDDGGIDDEDDRDDNEGICSYVNVEQI
jgi:hypothetical protein